MTGPLAGVAVLELPAIGPVPMLGMLLSDLGASVTRIDRPGDHNRGLGHTSTPSAMDRGRRSICVDLRRDDAAEIVLRLIDRSDVLIEGFRPGVTERLGIGPEPALERNPALVYGRMTGWGQDGPLAPYAGHDICYLAISGALHGIGEPDGPPVPPVNYLADFGGGSMMLATGVLAALLHARATGAGQVIDAAMTDGAAYLTTMTRTLLAAGEWQDRRGTNLLDGGAPNYRCYRCADGEYVAVGALEPKFWKELVGCLGRDPAEVPSPYDPERRSECADWLSGIFASRTRDAWAELFTGTDACVVPVLSLTESEQHPHNVARQSFAQVSGASVSAPTPRMSQTPANISATGRIGADTAAVLTDLGYDRTEQDQLRAAGVIT